MFLMDDREERIVAAALRVILRYGVRRTTMNDIAKEAGLVRQTLYNVFASKEEVLRATIRRLTEQALADIEAAAAETDGLGGKLDAVFEHLVLRHFDMLRASPDADDIIRGFNEAAREEIALATERYRAVVEAMLLPYEAQLSASGLTAKGLSDCVQQAMMAFKHDARDRAHLSGLLATLRVLILTVTGRD